MKTIIQIKVRGYHIDQFKHVNHSRYLEFLEEGRWAFFEKNQLIKIFHEKRISHVTVNININYRKSAFVGQVLKIETDVLRKSKRSVTMLQKVFINNTDTLIADAEVTNAFLNGNTGEVLHVDNEVVDLWPGLAKINYQE